MLAFEIEDMTCGRCASTITKAVKGADKDAKVDIDLARHRVEIEPSNADANELSDAIKEAGYTPVAVASALDRPTSNGSTQRGGCCCR